MSERLTRTEWLEIIYSGATTDMAECVAWIMPILERSGVQSEDTRTEKRTC
jgi:hypothetical protein